MVRDFMAIFRFLAGTPIGPLSHNHENLQNGSLQRYNWAIYVS